MQKTITRNQYGNTKKLRPTQTKTPLKTEIGEYTQNTKHATTQWAKWIKGNFQMTTQQGKPTTQHIPEETWEAIQEKYTAKTPPEHTKGIAQIHIREDMQTIKTHSQLDKTTHKHPQIEHMITKKYTTKSTTSDPTSQKQITRGRRNPRRSI